MMDWAVKKFGKILKPMQYIVIFSGYVLMISMTWLLVQSTYNYITSPVLVQLIRAPPIAPLIPYFPQLFGLESFFPPLYFTYFLVALVIVAVSHEFAHGIFARLNKIKIKTTGFAFLGPILGAFVEPDEKQMAKAPKFQQLSILGAGTFANVVMTVLFGLILWAFFVASFTPAGVYFNSYGTAAINTGEIMTINGVEIDNFLDAEIPESEDFLRIETDREYLTSSENLRAAQEREVEQMIVFEDSPAINARLSGAIIEVDGVAIDSHDKLREVIRSHEPGEEVVVVTNDDGEIREFEITLGDREGVAYLGVGVVRGERSGVVGWIFSQIEKVKDPAVYYAPKHESNFAEFVYNGLWWVVVINILVALFNMLPVSILDGGRFFYLTVWGITGNEKIGKKAFSFATWFIVFLLLAMTFRWLVSF